MSYRNRLVVLLAGLSALLAAFGAFAFPIGPQPESPSQLVEYFNTVIGHYFYTLNSDEIAAIDAGAAGPGWVKTGLILYAFRDVASSGNSAFPTCDKKPSPCVPVSRFYGTPGLGPNSHFYTANEAEAAGLMKPGTGWTFEEIAFVAPLPDATTHECAAGTLPVFRFYNGRFRDNDSNHRYTASPDAAARMRAAGWIDEGIAFCSLGRGTTAIEKHDVTVPPDTSRLLQQDVCDRELNAGRSCLAFSNVPVPYVPYAPAGPSFADQMADAFSGKTLIASLGSGRILDAIGQPAESREAASADVFVQFHESPSVFGIGVSTVSKGPSPYSSIMPMKRLPAVAGEIDQRLFPFASRYETSYELRFSFEVAVRPIVLDAGSAGYGVGMIEYQDRVSGLRMRANLLAYGTPTPADFVVRDAKDGVVIVGSSFKPGSPFGRNFGSLVHVPVLPPPATGDVRAEFAWFVKREEFMQVLAAARTVEPALSADPADYFVRRFGVSNEIYGSGRMGLTEFFVHLELAPVFEPL